MIPWIYHRLTPRDQGSDLLRVVSFRLSASGLLATLTIPYTVPPERLFLVTSINMFGVGGAAQNTDRFALQVTSPLGDSSGEWIRPPMRDNVLFSQNAGSFEMTGSPCLMVAPRSIMNFVCFFSAAAAANALTVGVNGILIPHGTFS